jgi:hypothetical protein
MSRSADVSIGDGSLRIAFPTARLEIEQVERLLRHLDQLWAEVVQLVEFLAPEGHPAPRNQVARPTVVRAGLTQPHEISLLDGDPPARAGVWPLYRRVLAAPSAVTAWLPDMVARTRRGWDAGQRARHDAALTAAIAPLTSQRRAGGEPGSTVEAPDPVQRLLRRIELQAGQVQLIAGPATLHGPAGRTGA